MANTFTGKTMMEQVRERQEAERNAKAERIAKRKRVIFVRRLIAVSFLLMGLFTTVSFAHGVFEVGKEKVSNHISEQLDESIKQYDQVEITVKYGETAWDIQSALTPDKDVRDMLVLVERVNKKFAMENVRAGETIIFLKEKEQK